MKPRLVPRVPPAPVSVTRADSVSEAVRDALSGYRDVLNAPVTYRSVQIDVKLEKNGVSVRAVLISTQGEVLKR